MKELLPLMFFGAVLYLGQLITVYREFSENSIGLNTFSKFKKMSLTTRCLICLIPISTYIVRNLLKRGTWELTCYEHNMVMTETPRWLIKCLPTTLIFISALLLQSKPEHA